MKQLFLLSGGADSITMLEKYFETNGYHQKLEFIYIDHEEIQIEKKIMELNAINKYFNYLEEKYKNKFSLNIIKISRRLYTREKIFGAHHNPMWLGAIISVLPALPKKFILNIGLTKEDHMSKYYEILRDLMQQASKLYEWGGQIVKYKLVAPIIQYDKHYIYNYLYSKKLISMFWTCEGLQHMKMTACGECAKCKSHKKLMKDIVSNDDLLKIECERHMSFHFNELKNYIKQVFELNDMFLLPNGEFKLPIVRYEKNNMHDPEPEEIDNAAMNV